MSLAAYPTTKWRTARTLRAMRDDPCEGANARYTMKAATPMR